MFRYTKSYKITGYMGYLLFSLVYFPIKFVLSLPAAGSLFGLLILCGSIMVALYSVVFFVIMIFIIIAEMNQAKVLHNTSFVADIGFLLYIILLFMIIVKLISGIH